MTMRVAINGFGRMGRLVLRAIAGRPELARHLDVVAINDIAGDAATAAHLLEFDTVHGRWVRDIGCDGDAVLVDGRRIPFSAAPTPAEVAWSGETVDMVMDCSGAFRTAAALQPYFDAGLRKVLVSAPVRDEAAVNLVVGVNDDTYDPARHHLVTAASCTTNCLAPVVKVVHEAIGIVHGSITTIHDVTNTQTIVDAPHKDLRRARSCLNSLVPTTTGSATAITMIYPELKGRLNGHAVRVPLLNASLTDCVFEMARDTTADEVNALFQAASAGPLAGILGYEERPLVSADFVNDPRSAIVDGPSTMVIDGRQLKVYAWYDNEWGYVNRMAELAARMAGGA